MTEHNDLFFKVYMKVKNQYGLLRAIGYNLRTDTCMKNSLLFYSKMIKGHAPTQFSGGKNIFWGKGGGLYTFNSGKNIL